MVTGKATLVIDLGNSETRVRTYYGKNKEGQPRYRQSILSNRFGIIPEEKLGNYLNSDYYTEEDSRIFNYNGSYYCNGKVCDTEFATTAVRPTALEKKYESLVTKLSLQNAFSRGHEDIALFTNNYPDGIEVEWDVIMLLPPDDIDAGAKPLSEMVKSINEVDFEMPKLHKAIKVNKVSVIPEGFAALLGVIFESKGVIRKGYEDLLDGDTKTMVIDIGAGTTDFIVAQGTNIISSLRFTKEVGGNNVHQKVRRLLKDKGVALSDSVVRKGCETGAVKSGNRTIDITNFITVAKATVSKQLVDAIQEYFEDNMMSVQEINNILVVGGGAESSEGVKPIADYMVEFLRRVSPDVHLVEIPEIEISGDNQKCSPRTLNIIGAGILAE